MYRKKKTKNSRSWVEIIEKSPGTVCLRTFVYGYLTDAFFEQIIRRMSFERINIP